MQQIMSLNKPKSNKAFIRTQSLHPIAFQIAHWFTLARLNILSAAAGA